LLHVQEKTIQRRYIPQIKMDVDFNDIHKQLKNIVRRQKRLLELNQGLLTNFYSYPSYGIGRSSYTYPDNFDYTNTFADNLHQINWRYQKGLYRSQENMVQQLRNALYGKNQYIHRLNNSMSYMHREFDKFYDVYRQQNMLNNHLQLQNAQHKQKMYLFARTAQNLKFENQRLSNLLTMANIYNPGLLNNVYSGNPSYCSPFAYRSLYHNYNPRQYDLLYRNHNPRRFTSDLYTSPYDTGLYYGNSLYRGNSFDTDFELQKLRREIMDMEHKHYRLNNKYNKYRYGLYDG